MGRDKVCAKSRVKCYPPGTLHEDKGILFCSSCAISLDCKKHIIDSHLRSKKHTSKRKLETKDEVPQKAAKQVSKLCSC